MAATRPNLRGRLAALAWTAALAFLVTACSSDHTAPQPRTYDEALARQVFAKAYETLTDKYLRPVHASELAVRGVGGLSSIDPAFEASRHDAVLRVVWAGQGIEEIRTPDSGDVSGWARVTARTVDLGRKVSPLIAAASAEEIYKAVLGAALAPLDRHTRYAGLRSARDYRAQREGFGGIGVRLNFDHGQPEIITVLPDTPAEEGQLRAGDALVEVDGTPVTHMDRDMVIWRLRGDVGTAVTLTVTRKDVPLPLTYTLKRARIFSPTVHLSRRGDNAVIAITGFNQRTARNLMRTIRKMQGAQTKPNGLILDLRGNPGGLLDQAVAVADAFLGHGRVVSTRGRHPDSFQLFDAKGRDIAERLPLVVLINGQSASAAEIVAAALQDQGRAVVVGSNSYGKGSIQNITRLPNDGELILTWSRFHAPSGYALENLGVVPNFCTNRPDRGGSRNVASTDTEPMIEPLAVWAAEAGITLAAWRTHSGYDAESARALRERCPRRSEKPDEDLKVAAKVLADTELYSRAIGASQPILARSGN